MTCQRLPYKTFAGNLLQVYYIDPLASFWSLSYFVFYNTAAMLFSNCFNVHWLDWKARADVVKLLKHLKKELTILAVSHDLKSVFPFPSSIFFTLYHCSSVFICVTTVYTQNSVLPKLDLWKTNALWIVVIPQKDLQVKCVQSCFLPITYSLGHIFYKISCLLWNLLDSRHKRAHILIFVFGVYFWGVVKDRIVRK